MERTTLFEIITIISLRYFKYPKCTICIQTFMTDYITKFYILEVN